jgi:hypothetical protein
VQPSQPALAALCALRVLSYSATVPSWQEVMVQQRVALVLLATVVSPALLVAVASAGAALGCAPMHVASLLPASTTTGLALTWPSGMALVREEVS